MIANRAGNGAGSPPAAAPQILNLQAPDLQTQDLALTYSLCCLGGVNFGLPASHVSEIFLLPELSPGGGASPAAVGTIEVRGEVLSAFDLAVWLLGSPQRLGPATHAAIVTDGDRKLVAIIGEVREIMTFHPEDLSELGHGLGLGASSGNDSAHDVDPPSSHHRALVAGAARTAAGPLALVDAVALLDRAAAETAQTSDRSSPGSPQHLPMQLALEALSVAERELLRQRAERLRRTSDLASSLEGELDDGKGDRSIAIFGLGEELLALDLAWVREFIDIDRVTTVPGALPALRGLFNLRGEIIPLLEINQEVGGSGGLGQRQRAIVLEVKPWGRLAIAVDRLLDLTRASAQDILPVPTAGRGGSGRWLLGEIAWNTQAATLFDLPAWLGEQWPPVQEAGVLTPAT